MRWIVQRGPEGGNVQVIVQIFSCRGGRSDGTSAKGMFRFTRGSIQHSVTMIALKMNEQQMRR